MNIVQFTLIDRATGEVLRSAGWEEGFLPQETADTRLLRGVLVNGNTHRVDPVTLQPVERAITKRDAWRASLPAPEPEERDVLLEAIRTKHGITPAELLAARAKLKAAKGLQA